jgi:hypothetical protein
MSPGWQRLLLPAPATATAPRKTVTDSTRPISPPSRHKCCAVYAKTISWHFFSPDASTLPGNTGFGRFFRVRTAA